MNPQFQLMLQQAIEAFQTGHFDTADGILKRILQVDQKNLPALHVLGLIKASQEKFKDAAELLGKAARIAPDDASIQYNLAKALMDNGSVKESITHHKKAVALSPGNPEAWMNFGKAASILKDFEHSVSHFEKAINLNSSYAEAWFNKGNALRELKFNDESMAAYDEAIKIKPDYVEAILNKGGVLQELKQYESAIDLYDQTIKLKPDSVEAWSNKGGCLHELKQYEEAVIALDKAISLNGNYALAWSNKALSLLQLKKFPEAISHYEQAIRIRPDFLEAIINKGNLFYDLKRFHEAIEQYLAAINLNPKYAEAMFCLANTLVELRLYKDAILNYEKGLALKPDADWYAGEIMQAKLRIASWDGFDGNEEAIKNFAESQKLIPFNLLVLTDSGKLNKKCSEVYIEEKYRQNSRLGNIAKLNRKDKIRIGYLSADFSTHPVAFLSAQLFEMHDRDCFEVYAFSSRKVSEQDAMRTRLIRAFDHFIDIDDLSDLEVAKQIRGLEIEIVIDLSGLTKDSRTGVLACRAAPIQVNYLGYPGTMGAPYVDYIIADSALIPENLQGNYTEKIVYLPNTYQVNDSTRPISTREFSRKELGLPEFGFVFCCFNNNFKILPNIFDGWMRILNSVPGSVLWLYEDNEFASENLTKEAIKRGVDADRIVFAKRMSLADHLARHQYADLFLDTFPYNAHTTASDALWAGLPLITVMGESFASRVAASLLKAIGLPEMIAESREAYECLAIDLAKNPEKLSAIKSKLADNRLKLPLFDTKRFAKNIESAYVQMVERYQADAPVENLYIEE
ncbi:tetratricopeptide repeat protein [Polynucleobacter sp. KF022]|uniref:tetratricopeptide repeat protein n=1 Tax=Polynucleobacter sp. KF022 TaxID=2982615 RepID=UPI0023777E61|nr:tetratricopeptide repeat protein [Polynucleobacter sp. KF022]BDT75973.1 hypothetical protein PKF022_16380 [Polynucleobacter sp. KF022]